MSIFLMKMVISLAPSFLCMDNKTVKAVIMQLEHESKTEKEDPDKGNFKEKKSFDENINHHVVTYTTYVAEVSVLHNLENALYTDIYHPIVPTPPPNA